MKVPFSANGWFALFSKRKSFHCYFCLNSSAEASVYLKILVMISVIFMCIQGGFIDVWKAILSIKDKKEGMCPCMWAFCTNLTTPNQLLMMLIFLFLSCSKKYFYEALQPHWIQLGLLHILSTAWWWQELSLSMPQEFGSGSACWFWFFILIPLKCLLFFTGFSPCISCQFFIYTETVAFCEAFFSKNLLLPEAP